MNTLRLAPLCLLVLVVSCMKQTPPPARTDSGAIDPRTDIAAVYLPSTHLLYVLNADVDTVLRVLEAKPDEDSTYSFSAITWAANQQQVRCKLRPVDAASLWLELTEQQRLIAALEEAHRAADRDPNRGTLIGKLDSQGVFYRVYKNAECMEITKGWEMECQERMTYRLRPDSTIEIIPTGMYQKLKRYPQSHCRKGKGFCVEAFVVQEIAELWPTAGCQGGPSSIEVIYREFSCVK